MAERTVDAISEISDALKLAQVWIGNSYPVVELEGQKPMPVIAAALERIEDLAQLRKDAERYRKLRASDGWKDSALLVVNNSQITRSEKVFSGDRLDAAVDAMA